MVSFICFLEAFFNAFTLNINLRFIKTSNPVRNSYLSLGIPAAFLVLAVISSVLSSLQTKMEMQPSLRWFLTTVCVNSKETSITLSLNFARKESPNHCLDIF